VDHQEDSDRRDSADACADSAGTTTDHVLESFRMGANRYPPNDQTVDMQQESEKGNHNKTGIRTGTLKEAGMPMIQEPIFVFRRRMIVRAVLLGGNGRPLSLIIDDIFV
jgi:hypothetical protein